MPDEKREETFKPMSKHREEEEYFFKQDQELLRTLREKADLDRHRVAREHQKELHWMRCPKCGGQMEEVAVDVLRIDRCQDCAGIYFDDGELEILSKLQTESDFLARLLSGLKSTS